MAKRRKTKLIPYATIVAAKNGDAEAMETILQHYDPYITLKSRRTYRDELGIESTFVDEDIRNRIRLKLMLAIINDFDVDSPPPGETIED